MRISFLGKGGSGKTTVSTAFIKYLIRENEKVLAIDADINVHLTKALEIENENIGDKFDEISIFLEGMHIANNNPIMSTLVPSSNSRFINPTFEDEFFKKYGYVKDNFCLLSVGTYNKETLGYSCFHTKLSSLMLFYNRFLDNDEIITVTDMTAGVDAVGTSMYAVSDLNIFVVEPTEKSIEVYKDFMSITNKSTETYVILNKIEDKEDIEYVYEHISSELVIGCIYKSNNLKKFERGDRKSFDDFVEEIEDINLKIFSALKNKGRDWDSYYDIHKKIFIDSAVRRHNKFFGEDVTKFIEKDFSYKNVIDSLIGE